MSSEIFTTYTALESPILTLEGFQEIQRRVLGPGLCGPTYLRLYRRPDPMITVPVRRHPRKKLRLQKKWLKRYGTRTIVDPSVDLTQMLIDRERGVLYCFAAGEQALLQALEQVNATVGEWKRQSREIFNVNN